MRVVYSDHYDLNIGNHIFPAVKYRMTRDRLMAEGVIHGADVAEPESATDEDVARVHEAGYIHKLKTGELDDHEIMQMEVPYSPQLVRAVWLAAGGSTLAGRLALEQGASANIGGGFHHAFPDHGEGFCIIHDVAVAIRALQAQQRIARAMTIDLDVHQGNGTAHIFASDPTVYTFSMHQARNYPAIKPPSNLDVNLEDGTGDYEYLAALEDGLNQAFAAFKPDLIFYVAGADPYREDQLGGLKLTLHGLEDRDRMVFTKAREHGVPVAVALAGGYARRVEDTVRIHATTISLAKEIAAVNQPPRRCAGN